MRTSLSSLAVRLLIALAVTAAFCDGLTQAATVWTGPAVTFSKAASADQTQAANQDRLTDHVWITRGSTQGLINAAVETFYTRGGANPTDTEWAYGDLSNYASLTYVTWEALYAHNSFLMTTTPAVLHLISDDIYLSVQFNSWGQGFFGGGAFSYTRSSPATAPPPPPAQVLSGATVLANGSFRFTFTNSPGYVFMVLSSPDATAPVGGWTVAGAATEGPAGTYTFTASATGAAQNFYRVRWP
jgi:hypothetical protein